MVKIIKKVTLNAPASTSTGVDPTKGTQTNPYTQEEYEEMLLAGTWYGGWVEGIGYREHEGFLIPTVEITGSLLYKRYELVSIARSYVGIGSKNNSDVISSWLAAVGEAPSSPWCAAFVSAVFREAGIEGANSAWVPNWASWGIPTNDPKIGDVAIYSFSHVGIVSAVNASTVMIIAGNTSSIPGAVTDNHVVSERPSSKDSLTFRTNDY